MERITFFCQAPVAHPCNPQEAEINQEDHSSMPARAKEDCISKPSPATKDPVLKLFITKKGWWSDPSGRAPA
jgi:hypothetical protein